MHFGQQGAYFQVGSARKRADVDVRNAARGGARRRRCVRVAQNKWRERVVCSSSSQHQSAG
eukprot:1041797-Pleurochrysis_carterae.AAC.1